MLSRLFQRKRSERSSHDLYAAAVGQARRIEFYESFEVPDSLDGRFDMIALHVFLIVHRLKGQGQAAADCAQGVVEAMVADMDQSLREIGIGDLGVPKRVRDMVLAFYGRVAAYQEALAEADDRKLLAALDRNLYGTVEVAEETLTAMADYMRRSAGLLADQPVDRIVAGRVEFADPPVDA